MSERVLVFQNAATANGNGNAIPVEGYLGAQQVEIAETAGGTATVTFEGTFDGTNYYAVGYYPAVESNASLSRTVTAVSVLANSRHVYQLLDPYPNVRARISSVAGGASVTVKAYVVG